MNTKDMMLIVRVIRMTPIPQTNRVRLIDKFVEEMKAADSSFDEFRFRLMCTQDWMQGAGRVERE